MKALRLLQVGIWALAGVLQTLVVWLATLGTWSTSQTWLVAGLWIENAVFCALCLLLMREPRR